MKYALALIAGAALAALPVALAGAQDPLPKPCAGDVWATDPAGDQEIGPIIGGPPGGPTNTKAPDNMDLRSVFLITRDGKTTVNIQVTNLSKTVPPEIRTGHFSYFLDFATTDGYTFVRAETNGTTVSYHAGKVTTVGPANNPVIGQEDLKGQFLEGPDGIVQIELPPALGKPGLKLTGGQAFVSMRSDEENYVGYLNDVAPAAAKDLTIPAECPEPAGGGATPTETTETTTTTTTSTPPPPAPTPQPTPTPPQDATPPPPPGTLPARGTLTADAAVDNGKRATAVRRGLRARVRCSVQCRVRASATVDKRTARKLRLGRKATRIGSGRATITRAGRIPFHVKFTKKAKRALRRKGVRKFALTVALQVTDTQGGQLKRITKKPTLR